MSPHYCIALQPICNTHMRHIGDELLYRGEDPASTATVSAARACSSAFYEVGLSALVGTRLLLMSVTEDCLTNLDLSLFPPTQVLLQLTPELNLQGLALANLTALRAQHFRTVLHYPEQINAVTWEQTDVVRCQQGAWPDSQQMLRFGQAGKQLLACGIDTHSQLEQAQAYGFGWFQGEVFATPASVANPIRQRTSNRIAQLKLLAELHQQEPDLQRLEAMLLLDPHFVLLVLKQANNQARSQQEITRLQQAIMLIGLNRLRFMATTLLLAQNSQSHRVLLEKMLVRAALCKRVAQRLGGPDPDDSFLMGLFSLLQPYENITLEQLLRLIPLRESIATALLHRSGELGRLLRLVEAFEGAQLSHQSAQTIDLLNTDYLASVAWVRSITSILDG